MSNESRFSLSVSVEVSWLLIFKVTSPYIQRTKQNEFYRCSAKLLKIKKAIFVIVCMYKKWAIKLALAPRPLMIYCASPLAAAMIITVAALRIVLAHGSKPT
jgi:hypothetical protein